MQPNAITLCVRNDDVELEENLKQSLLGNANRKDNEVRIRDIVKKKKLKSNKNQKLFEFATLNFTNLGSDKNAFFNEVSDVVDLDVLLQFHEMDSIGDGNQSKNSDIVLNVNDPSNTYEALLKMNISKNINKETEYLIDLFRIISNKCLELEILLNGSDKIEQESMVPEEKSMKKGKKKRKLNSKHKKNNTNDPLKLVSNLYKDFLLTASTLTCSKDFKYWMISVNLCLIYSESQFNKFSTDTARLLDTIYSKYISKNDITGNLKSNFLQKIFNHQITDYTKSHLKNLNLTFDSKIDGLNNITLLPFQMETIQWMLNKERNEVIMFNENVNIELLNDFLNLHISYGYEIMKRPISEDHHVEQVKPTHEVLFWNKFTNYIATYQEAFLLYKNFCKQSQEFGTKGLVSEEMGLGKTIEVLSVLLLNQRNLPKNEINDDSLYYTSMENKRIRKAKTTLICCPNAILQQWLNEINSHSSSISVFHYKGYHHVKDFFKLDSIEKIVSSLSKYDIIITSYNTVSVEVHYAEYNANSRKRRNAELPKYNYSSPLSLIQFYRIVLDEVQMLRSDSTNAAKCTSLLHRVHTWGVSGTPIQVISDIHTVLSYLQIHPFKDIHKIISSINSLVVDVTKQTSQNPEMKSNQLLNQTINGVKFNINDLLNIFEIFDLCIRHTKHDVKSQINIPEQLNYMVSLEFSPIEWDNYLVLWDTFLETSGYNSDGSGRTRLSTIDLNQWLNKLRYLCCHAVLPDSHNKHASKNNKQLSNIVHNIDDILKIMNIEAAEKLDSLYRENYQLKIKAAQAKMELQNNPKSAIELLFELKEQLISDLDIKCNVKDPFNLAITTAPIKNDTDSEKAILPDGTFKNDDTIKIRSYMDLLHQCLFFIATGYYFIGSHKLEKVDDDNEKQKLLAMEKNDNSVDALKVLKYSDVYDAAEMKIIESNQLLEQKYYELADLLRKQILDSRIRKVDETIIEVKNYFGSSSQKRSKTLEIIDFNSKDDFSTNMIVSRIFKSLGILISSLNEQAIQFNDLMQQLFDISYAPLSKTYVNNDSEEVKNEKAQEYSDSIEFQDKAFAIFSSLERILQNRNAVLTSEEDIKLPKKLITSGQKLSDFHLDLLSKLKLVQGTPFKSLFDELKNLRVVNGSTVPIASVNVTPSTFEDYLSSFETHITTYKKELRILSESLKRVNAIYNSKVEYFSHLQKISDSLVSLLQLEPYQRTSIIRSIKNDSQYKVNLKHIVTTESRLKYLSSLSNLQESIEQNKSFTCPICLGIINSGAMISCGHFFCGDCIFNWLKHNHNCPLCKKDTALSQLYNFKFKNGITNPKPKIEDSKELIATDAPKIKILGLNDDIFKEKYLEYPNINDVHNIVIKTSFGSKIDFTIKLILYLKLKAVKEKDEEPQILMYSQSMEFLSVIIHVLKLHDIKYLSCLSNGSNVGKTISNFKEDPSITCLLLNVKSLGAGLNLLNARHIFILDPIINHGEELQAMSRNNRIGQSKTTFVWNLMIRNSVEENILRYKCKLENKKRAIKQEKELDMDEEMSSIEEQQFELNEGAGEIVSKNHLWSCLFQK